MYAAGVTKRINIILPEKTVAVLDRVASRGNRSRFIDRAVRHLVEIEGKASLRARLKEEAIANAERDLAMAAEWLAVEQGVSRRASAGGEPGNGGKPPRNRRQSGAR